MTITAAAPSLSGQALPAVTRPSGRNTGFRPDSASSVVPARGPSSLLTTVPSGVVTGVISRSQKPLSIAFSARFCDADGELVHVLPGDVLEQRQVLGGLAHGDVDVGDVAVLARVVSSCRRRSRRPWPRAASASAKTGLWVSGSASELPFTKRDTISTPAEMNTSPSPALMACRAMRVVCSDEEQ